MFTEACSIKSWSLQRGFPNTVIEKKERKLSSENNGSGIKFSKDIQTVIIYHPTFRQLGKIK